MVSSFNNELEKKGQDMQEFFFKYAEDGTYCVQSYEGDEPEVIVPEIYCGKPVTILLDGLFSGHSEITSVQIPDSVTQMGGFLFDGCLNLHQITLPKELRDMWGYAFARCGIEEILLPEHVKSIVPFTFKDCKQLKTVICNPGLKKIYSWAFSGCDRLDDLRCGPDVEISPQAFETKK